MRVTSSLCWLFILSFLPTSLATASELVTLPYDPIEAAQLLEVESQLLLSEVKSSNLGYSVKESVAAFSNTTTFLRACLEETVGHEVECQLRSEEVLTAFVPAERFLSITSVSYPAIYQHYEKTRVSMDWLRPDSGDPDQPGTGQLQVQGSLDNHTYLFTGFSPNDLNEECLKYGHERHIPYVARLSVNGTWFGSGSGSYLKLSEACAILAQYSN